MSDRLTAERVSHFDESAWDDRAALLGELTAVRAEKAAIAEAVFAIAKSADGGHSYEVTLTNMLRAVGAAIDVVGKNGGSNVG